MSDLDDLIAAVPRGHSRSRGKCPGCGADNEVSLHMQIRDSQNRSGLGVNKALATVTRAMCASCATQAFAEFKAKWSRD